MSRDGLTLGEIIKKEMRERGIKDSVVARKMNVARQSINQIDKRKKFDLQFLQEFKKASGLDYTIYATENTVALLQDPETTYQSKNRVTLTLNVSCNRNNVGDFSAFLTQIEEIAEQYGYHFV